MTTKEKILDIALTLFSTQGYDAVSIRDIAKQVGIKESSIYNHFLNKQAIFDGILALCQNHMMKHYEALNLDQTLRGDFEIYDGIPADQLTQIALEHFKFYVSDDIMFRYRRLLTIEQFRTPSISLIYRDLFVDQPIQFQSRLFQFLMDRQALKKDDPQALAYDFYAPIFLLMCRYDELNDEAERLLKQHIQHFIHRNAIR
jgi:AcrR family transcriptional regulator